MDDARVLLLGIDTPIGLTLVRELAAHGVEVHGIAASARGLGLHSRYLHAGYLRAPDSDGLVAQLNDIAARARVRLLMAVSEGDLMLLGRVRARLAGLRPLIPDARSLSLVLDKAAACEAARLEGIDVPATHEVGDAAEAARLARGLRYPVILKWRDPNAVHAALAHAGLALVKAEYCYDAAHLTRTLARYDAIGRYPLVQSFCPGHGLGQMVFMHRGEALLRFQHRRLHEWPPEGGVSTLCESVGLDQHPALFEKSVRLLRRLGWEGAAMVEYRYDPRTGRAAFMEINGRFWGSLPLASQAGAHFGWFTYMVQGQGVVPTAPPYRVGLRCRFMVPELKRLGLILLRPGAIQNRALRFDRLGTLLELASGFLSFSQRCYVFTWRDPKPCLADLGGAVQHALRELARRIVKRGGRPRTDPRDDRQPPRGGRAWGKSL